MRLGPFVDAYESITVDISSVSPFNAGQPPLRLTKIGNVVTMSWEALAHSSSSAPTATGVIPARFRPSKDVCAVFQSGSTVIEEMNIYANGNLEIEYRDFAGTLTARTSSNRGCMSWRI